MDPGTLAKWEQGKREPQGAFLGWVKRFLQNEEVSGARRAVAPLPESRNVDALFTAAIPMVSPSSFQLPVSIERFGQQF